MAEEKLYKLFYYGTIVLAAAMINNKFSEYGLAWILMGCIIGIAYLSADKFKEISIDESND